MAWHDLELNWLELWLDAGANLGLTWPDYGLTWRDSKVTWIDSGLTLDDLGMTWSGVDHELD